ncbi:MAG: 5-formyltetrahydrofolate cyclo-ligase [Candidatus Omnitrophota bacterium]
MGKSEIRRMIIERVKGQGSRVKEEKDKIIRQKLSALPEYKEAKTIGYYVSMDSEVDTRALIDDALEAGKTVAVPVIAGDDLRFYRIENRGADLAEGPCGILQPDESREEPFSNDRMDLVIVPGLAFSKEGARLGRGRGFYDRFLKGLPGRIKKIGLAYDIQIIQDLPVTPQDVPVDTVVTN